MKHEFSESDIVLSVSSIKDFQSCFRKYQFKNEQCIVPMHTSSPLQIGDAYHRGLQNYYGGWSPKEVLVDIKNYYIDQQDEFDDEVFGAQCVKNSMITRAMLIGYMFKYAADEFFEITPEKEFCIPIYEETGMRVWIAGKRDGIYKADGKNWLLENKTTSETDYERYKKKLLLDIQSTLYIIATEIELQETIHGVFYNVARKPFLKQKEKESDNAFYDRLKFDYVNRADDFYFRRLWIYRSEDDKQELMSEIIQIARDLQSKRKHGDWYRNLNACTQYGTCPYLPICMNKPTDEEIEMAYKKVKKFPELQMEVE